MKVTITITDNEAEGTVTLNVEFDPPISNDMRPSGAMHLANLAIEAMKAENED